MSEVVDRRPYFRVSGRHDLELLELTCSTSVLDVSGCDNLVAISGDTRSLSTLNLRKCRRLEHLPNLSGTSSVRISECGIKGLYIECVSPKMCFVYISDCPDISKVEVSGNVSIMLERCASLCEISTTDSKDLKSSEELRALEVSDCQNLSKIHMSGLWSFCAKNCNSLVSIEGCTKGMGEFIVVECSSMKILPSLEFRCLTKVEGCPAHKTIEWRTKRLVRSMLCT